MQGASVRLRCSSPNRTGRKLQAYAVPATWTWCARSARTTWSITRAKISAETVRKYDLIYDTIGNRSVSDYRRALNPAGKMCHCGVHFPAASVRAYGAGTADIAKQGSESWYDGSIECAIKKICFISSELLETGKVVSVIDRRYPFSETAEAIRYLETLHARGKVIINVEPAFQS